MPLKKYIRAPVEEVPSIKEKLAFFEQRGRGNASSSLTSLTHPCPRSRFLSCLPSSLALLYSLSGPRGRDIKLPHSSLTLPPSSSTSCSISSLRPQSVSLLTSFLDREDEVTLFLTPIFYPPSSSSSLPSSLVLFSSLLKQREGKTQLQFSYKDKTQLQISKGKTQLQSSYKGKNHLQSFYKGKTQLQSFY